MRQLKILLVNPPSPGIYNLIGLKLPPLGLAYLAAVCREKGHQVEIVDLQVEPKSKLHQAFSRCDLVGITSETNKVHQALKVAKEAKERFGLPVLMGGYHATFLDEEVLRSGWVDWVIRGEGEIPMSQFLEALDKKSDLTTVPGLSFLHQGKLVRTPQTTPPEDLDALPLPARELLPLSKYWMTQVEGEPAVNVLTSRGCPFSCSFCASSQFSGRKWRSRSPENIFQEIEKIYFDLGYRGIAFVDDNFTLSPERVERLCSKIEQNRLKLKWWCFSRADTIVQNESLVRKMARAGLRMVYLGVESVEKSILDEYKKKLSAEVARKAINILRKYNVKSWASFILGSIRDTRETILRTVEFAKNLAPDLVQFSVLTPFPGTEIYEKFLKEGRIVKLNWKLFDGAHPVLKGDFLDTEEVKKLLWKAYFEFYREWRYLPQAFSMFKKIMVTSIPPLAKMKETHYWKERLQRVYSSFHAPKMENPPMGTS